MTALDMTTEARELRLGLDEFGTGAMEAINIADLNAVREIRSRVEVAEHVGTIHWPAGMPMGKPKSNRPAQPEPAYEFASAGAAVVGEPASIPYKRAEIEVPSDGIEHRYVYRFVKRAFDIAFSLGVLVVFSWLYLIIALAVKLDDPSGPVFFKHTRVTKDGREFTMYKFRSMCVDAEEKLAELQHLNEKSGPVFKMADDPRITRVGKWIRKTSLDELPQFFNVFLGDMSVIGPRPALPKEVATYNDYQRQRLLVRGGLSCYWQTRRNRDTISFDEWVDLDLLYISQCGIWADFKLIVQTIGVVLTAQGS